MLTSLAIAKGKMQHACDSIIKLKQNSAISDIGFESRNACKLFTLKINKNLKWLIAIIALTDLNIQRFFYRKNNPQ